MAKPGPKKGDPRCKEYGKRGAEAVKAKYGDQFTDRMRELGSKGGKALVKSRGLGFLQKIGEKGGEANRQRLLEVQNAQQAE